MTPTSKKPNFMAQGEKCQGCGRESNGTLYAYVGKVGGRWLDPICGYCAGETDVWEKVHDRF